MVGHQYRDTLIASVEDNFCHVFNKQVFIFVAHDANTPMPAKHAEVDTPLGQTCLPKAGAVTISTRV